MKTKRLGCPTLLLLLLLALPARAEKESMLYRMQAGETLADIAQVYLGGPEFVPELLAYNNVQNPTSLGEGSLLVLPLEVRVRALGEIQKAESAVQAARDAGAERFAASLYREATAGLEAAREFRIVADYAKVGAMSERAVLLAEQAVEEANKNANEPKDGRVVLVHGNLSISEDEGATWRAAREGDVLPLTAWLRTDATSRGEVVLEDGSHLQILESTTVSIAQFLKDQRNGKIDAELRVIMGDLLGRIKPKATGDSKMEIKTGRASIAVRGTVLRVKADGAGDTRAELLEGSADLITKRGRKSRSVFIPTDFGVLAPAQKKPLDPIPLLPPPALVSPNAIVHETSRQEVELAWAPVKSCKLKTYHVEIASDTGFSRVVVNEFTPETRLSTGVLPQGDYYWRVSSLDRKALEGSPAEPRTLRIRKNLDVDLLYSGPLVPQGAGWVASPATLFTVRPAASDTSVVKHEYSVSGAPFQPVPDRLHFWQEGPVDLRVRGVGLEGDGGGEQRLRFQLDASPPEVSVAVGRPALDERGQPVVQAQIHARDDTGVKSVEYSLDGQSFEAYEKPVVLSALQTYHMRVRSEDHVGNRAPELTFRIAGEWVPLGHIGP